MSLVTIGTLANLTADYGFKPSAWSSDSLSSIAGKLLSTFPALRSSDNDKFH